MGNNQGRPGISAKEQVNALEEQARNRSAKPVINRSRIMVTVVSNLAKVLTQKSLESAKVDGIAVRVFCKHVYPQNLDLGEHLYRYFVLNAEETHKDCISEASFIHEADTFLTILDDKAQIETFFKIYSGEGKHIKKADFEAMFEECYNVAQKSDPTKPMPCPLAHQSIMAVADALFHGKEEVPISYAVSWVSDNCPRTVQTLHRFVVHQLATIHRFVVPTESATSDSTDDNDSIVELPTPVLDRTPSFINDSEPKEGGSDDPDGVGTPPLPHSQLWLLASVLPNLFLRPTGLRPSESSNGLHSFDASGVIARLVGAVLPSHWALLYNSDQHGLGGNRFQHHVFGYRGPSIMFIRAETNQEFCVACTDEWRESHQFWGEEDCMAIQLSPLFRVLERGAKLLYLNLNIRGYTQGIQVAKDPKKPVITINTAFTLVTYRGVPYPLSAIEVWGCGEDQLRNAQMDQKKWEVSQAQKQRKVNRVVVNWSDNPDKYLLELAGHESYTN